MVQLSHAYMTIGKTTALTRWTFVGQVMFLLFSMLSRLVIAFLPRSKHLLISWLQSPSAVTLETEKICHCFPIYMPLSEGTRCHELHFLNVEFKVSFFTLLFHLFFPFIFISWRLITLQHCSGFCHTLTWISHGFTCVPHPDPHSRLPLHPIPLGLPSAPALSTCLIQPGLVICFPLDSIRVLLLSSFTFCPRGASAPLCFLP